MHSDHDGIRNCEPSGHSRERFILNCHVPIERNCSLGDSRDQRDAKIKFVDFAGPYKDYSPPGDRNPAIGEKIWGDPPFLPSYLDPLYPSKLTTSGQADNLFFRGPFSKEVSETHTEFVNHGVLPERDYHEYVRHYEEPGMKDEKSVTHSDFQPPFPMLPRDKTPCLMEEPEMPWYKTKLKEPKNPHAKEHEVRPVQPQVVYVDDGYKRDFSTEHSEQYVCYQKDKSGTKIKDTCPFPEERFLRNIREEHQKCKHPPVSEECDGSCQVRRSCPGATSKRVSWLMQPKNYSFENGVMLIPCKCKNEGMRKC